MIATTITRPPLQLRGPLPLNSHLFPRYCGTIHVDFQRGHLSESTRGDIARAVHEMYETAEALVPPVDLDEVLIEGLITEAEVVLTSHLLRLKAQSMSTHTERTWRRGLYFVTAMLRLSSAAPGNEHLRARMLRLETAYSQLRITRAQAARPVRALPAVVVEELCEVFSPHGRTNPFRTEPARWRNYLLFLMLLHLGLRAGELLSLTVASVRAEFDTSTNAYRYWLDVENSDDPTESRSRRPRLKNVLAMRQLPLPENLARLADTYVVNFRGDQPHGFLFGSAEGRPLAISSLASLMHEAAARLSVEANRSFTARIRRTVTPHDLRHTSAVVRLQRLREAGHSLDEAIERLRPFFGWSPGSTMPLHYARAYFEPRFQDTWDETFSDTLRALRGAVGGNRG